MVTASGFAMFVQRILWEDGAMVRTHPYPGFDSRSPSGSEVQGGRPRIPEGPVLPKKEGTWTSESSC